METPKIWGVRNEQGFVRNTDGTLINFDRFSMAEALVNNWPETWVAEFPPDEITTTPTTLGDIDDRLYEILQYMKTRMST